VIGVLGLDQFATPNDLHDRSRHVGSPDVHVVIISGAQATRCYATFASAWTLVTTPVQKSTAALVVTGYGASLALIHIVAATRHRRFSSRREPRRTERRGARQDRSVVDARQ
jgi:hypothetical protein